MLEKIVEIDPATDVILMSAHYSTESAVEAVKKGASDYLNKPLSIDPLRERIGELMKTKSGNVPCSLDELDNVRVRRNRRPQ